MSRPFRSVHAVALIAMAALAWPAATGALILDSPTVEASLQRPFDDPAWESVGQRLGGSSVIYLGYGWVLTANHVGAGILLFDGVSYDPIPGTLRQLENVDGSASDLLLFRVADPPDLPPLRLAKTPPRPGEVVTLVAHGRVRGQPITIQGDAGEPLDGYAWASNDARHWGTNEVVRTPEYVLHSDGRTLAFATLFDRIDDPFATKHEAQGALGDSGGGVFTPISPYDSSGGWQLSGLIFTVSHFEGQPANASFYGDATFLADISHYREQIVAIARTECSNEIDDDGDGRTDHPADISCNAPSDDDESRVQPVIVSPAVVGSIALASALLAILVARLWRVDAPYSGVT